MPHTHRVLLLACSKEKRPLRGPVRPYDLYAGPLWTTYKKIVEANLKAKRADKRALPLCIVLSGRYGFISDNEQIEPYDEELTPRQSELIISSPVLRRDLDFWVGAAEHPSEVFLAGGKLYRQTMERALVRLNRDDLVVRRPEGPRGIGDIRRDLTAWLDESPLIRPRLL